MWRFREVGLSGPRANASSQSFSSLDISGFTLRFPLWSLPADCADAVEGDFHLPPSPLNQASVEQRVVHFSRNRQLDQRTVPRPAPKKTHQPESFFVGKVVRIRHAKAPCRISSTIVRERGAQIC
jgi:hypothetical protein